ncbi:MAG: cryptochrome/photolyase family protein, partial [Phycisphaeraceae bacterium]|nr:cryptochrome/photolyase family protein [Phycisphaeraceae bacterium]
MATSELLLVFPHQLFADHPGLADGPTPAALIEDSLFFGDAHHPARFHKQKLRFHRSTMKRYERVLHDAGCKVDYHPHEPGRDPLEDGLEAASKAGVKRVLVAEVHDHLLERRLRRHADRLKIELEILPTPMFLNTDEENRSWRETRKRWFMADFYKHQRRRLGILMEGDEPVGGRWSFDEDNRKKIPKAMMTEIPTIPTFGTDEIETAAGAHVESTYADNPGRLGDPIYPTSHETAAVWLQTFL